MSAPRSAVPTRPAGRATPGDQEHRPALQRDIADRDDIAALLTDFYGRAFDDELLGPVFVDVANMDLAEHLPVICDFWQTVLFHTGEYRRNALQPHLRLHVEARLTPAHFDRWLMLWRATVADRHAGPKAELAKLQATRIAGAMNRRITGVRVPGFSLPSEGASGRVGHQLRAPRRRVGDVDQNSVDGSAGK